MRKCHTIPRHVYCYIYNIRERIVQVNNFNIAFVISNLIVECYIPGCLLYTVVDVLVMYHCCY